MACLDLEIEPKLPREMDGLHVLQAILHGASLAVNIPWALLCWRKRKITTIQNGDYKSGVKLISVVPSRLLSGPITRASPFPLTAIPNPYHSSKLAIFSFGGDLVSKLRISAIKNGFLHFPTHDLMSPCLHPHLFFPCCHSSKIIFLSKATPATGAMDIIPPWLLRKSALWIMSFFFFYL